MEIVVAASPEDAGRKAAEEIARRLAGKRSPVLGVATGDSPQPIYRRLAALVRCGELDLSNARGFALDEYVGLPPEHDQSYHAVVRRDVEAPLAMPRDAIVVPDGMAEDLSDSAARFEESLSAAGGVDVQVLGIGGNGHVAFNEPGSPWSTRTRVVELTPETRAANARFFGDIEDVPRLALTQGIATILEARSIVLIATGAAKADAVRLAVDGHPSPEMPASALQHHSDVTVYLDPAAASGLVGLTPEAAATH